MEDFGLLHAISCTDLCDKTWHQISRSLSDIFLAHAFIYDNALTEKENVANAMHVSAASSFFARSATSGRQCHIDPLWPAFQPLSQRPN